MFNTDKRRMAEEIKEVEEVARAFFKALEENEEAQELIEHVCKCYSTLIVEIAKPIIKETYIVRRKQRLLAVKEAIEGELKLSPDQAVELFKNL